jgi:hypothetical protein
VLLCGQEKKTTVLSGKCFTAPELAHQKSENVGGTPEPFPLPLPDRM